MAISIQEAISFAGGQSAEYAGKFYGPVSGLTLGGGLIYSGLSYPIFNKELRKFQAYKGTVLVLTHECDVDLGNDKIFNADVIFAPVGSFEELFAALIQKRSDSEIKAFIGDLIRGRISQLFYLPPCEACPFGGAAYLNRIGNTHVAEFSADGVKALHALSGDAYSRLGRALEAHFLRPKNERLPLT